MFSTTLSLLALAATTLAVPCTDVSGFAIRTSSDCTTVCDSPCPSLTCTSIRIQHVDGALSTSKAWLSWDWTRNDGAQILQLAGVEDGVLEPPLGVTFASSDGNGEQGRVISILGNGEGSCEGVIGGVGAGIGEGVVEELEGGGGEEWFFNWREVVA
ncbi:hypothetical protein BJY04DRAFT_215698 [Aspergillus karnatakaensis]|uniref:uncharacterized protein n=1 Tax=Aspergillus karnatakaensis TaxID=1810916 RepID=UPI003CCCE812